LSAATGVTRKKYHDGLPVNRLLAGFG
jgi:hypothetical protein